MKLTALKEIIMKMLEQFNPVESMREVHTEELVDAHAFCERMFEINGNRLRNLLLRWCANKHYGW